VLWAEPADGDGCRPRDGGSTPHPWSSSHAFFAEAAAQLAGLLGVEVARTPATHFPDVDHPQELAQTVMPSLRRISR
jgi:hypothetical protein